MTIREIRQDPGAPAAKDQPIDDTQQPGEVTGPMTHTDEQHDRVDERTLATSAADGDEFAFGELSRRHAGEAWNLAHAICLDADAATAASADAFGQTFTALRAGRLDLTGERSFREALLTHTHGAATDRVPAHAEDVDLPVIDGADPHLVAAFADLPARWRGALWTRAVLEADDATVAAVTGLDADAVAPLLSRARNGLVERYLRTPAVGQPTRTCRRAVARLGRHVAGALPAGDAEKLERHLGSCESCTALYARLATLDAALPALAMAVPDEARDRARAAWTAALATGSRSGMSERAEKVLAGVSAFAAAVGVLGAALFAVSDHGGDDPVASAPLAPLVDDVPAPHPFDLSGGMALPVASHRNIGAGISSGAVQAATATAPTPAPAPAPSSPTPSSPAPVAATSPTDSSTPAVPDTPVDVVTDPLQQVTDQLPVPVPSDPVPDADVSLQIADQPIAVDVDSDPGLTAGPVSVGSEPQPSDDTVSTGGSLEPLAPVTDAVNSAADSLGL